MKRFLLPVKKSMAKFGQRLSNVRQRVINRALTLLYGTPVQVLPRGHAGLAAALVVWFWQDGIRHYVLVRSPKAKDTRARLLSCLSLANHPDMATALYHTLEIQLGRVFARTVDKKLLAHDRVAATPIFTYSDDATAIESPVQVLAWVTQIQPVQVELIEPGNGIETVIVAEGAMNAENGASALSPTHRAIWQSVVARHLPVNRNTRLRGDLVEEISADPFKVSKKPSDRTVH